MAPTHAGGLVFRQQEGRIYYLIVRAKPEPSHWVIPKGHIESGETPETAAVREILEETGVQAEIIATLGKLEFSYGGKQIHTIMYLMAYLGETAALEDRVSHWGLYEEIHRLLTFEDTRRMLSQAHELVRHQTGGAREEPDKAGRGEKRTA